MNHKRGIWLSSLLLLALVLGVAVFAQRSGGGASNSSGTRTSETAEINDQWEYLVVSGGNVNLAGGNVDSRMRKQPDDSFGREAYALEKNMDKLGAKGWQLVSVNGSSNDPVFYFKRRK